MKRLVAVALLAFFVSGCAANLGNFKYTPLETTPQLIGTSFTATPLAGWHRVTSDLDQANQTNWSAGPKGSRVGIRIWYDLKEGDALFRYVDPDFPLFRPDMTPSEIMTMFKDSLEFRELREVETTRLRTAAFGDAQGHRFDVSFRDRLGGLRHGTVLAAIVGEKLQMISYHNDPGEFEKSLGEVEMIMNSVELQ